MPSLLLARSATGASIRRPVIAGRPARRTNEVRERVKADFRSGVRAGVVTTPALFAWRDGQAEPVDVAELERRFGAVSP